jgi:hypothetical protein
MKSKIVKLLKEQYGLRRINGRKLESYRCNELCAYYDSLQTNNNEN